MPNILRLQLIKRDKSLLCCFKSLYIECVLVLVLVGLWEVVTGVFDKYLTFYTQNDHRWLQPFG